MEEKDFEEMRAQIAILKEKLNEQEIVSDRLVKQSMRDKVDVIKKMQRKQFGLALFACIIFPILHFGANLSWPLVIASDILMVFCVLATWYVNRPINDPTIYAKDVATTAGIFAKVKRQYQQWICYWAPSLCIPWIAWYAYDFLAGNPTIAEGNMGYFIVGWIVLCAGFGAIYGYQQHKKAVNACQEIIEQLSA